MKFRKTISPASICGLLVAATTVFASAAANGQTVNPNASQTVLAMQRPAKPQQSIVGPASDLAPIGPDSPALAQTLEQLQQAEGADVMSSTSWEEYLCEPQTRTDPVSIHEIDGAQKDQPSR